MNKLLSLRDLAAMSWASGAAASAVLLAAGCATAPPVAEGFMDVPMGTVTTYHRKSSGSLGSYDGKVVWTYSPATWAGKAVIAFGAPQAGVSLHEPRDFWMVAQLQANGKPVMSYDPPIGYQWPLQVGKQWTSKHMVTLHDSGRVVPLSIDWKVESWGDVTVPAGTFKAYKLVWTNSQGEVETRWANPQEGLMTIKRHVERPASHPQGPGVLDAELLSRVLPAR
jgi:hypothetical protein